MKKIAAEICGWYGAVALLLAFALVSFSIVSADQLSYQLLNITGAVGIVIVSLSRKAYPPALLNAVWAAIAAVAIFTIIF
jgi:hypothetical protein